MRGERDAKGETEEGEPYEGRQHVVMSRRMGWKGSCGSECSLPALAHARTAARTFSTTRKKFLVLSTPRKRQVLRLLYCKHKVPRLLYRTEKTQLFVLLRASKNSSSPSLSHATILLRSLYRTQKPQLFALFTARNNSYSPSLSHAETLLYISHSLLHAKTVLHPLYCTQKR